MNSEQLKSRTKTFALRCLKMAQVLPKNALGEHIRKQIIRSSTSVAANYRAACLASSRAAFAAKMSIVIEEIDETLFWMEIIVEEKLAPLHKMSALMQEAKELTSIFISSRKTCRKK